MAKQGDTQDQLSVTVQRGGANGASLLQVFEVPVQDNQTVLDVVSWIQQYADPTLSYRYACRVGMCGSCGMTVNGVPRWTCRTHVSKVVQDAALDLAPLRNLPVIKDLVVDMDPFFDKWVQAEGRHHASRTRDDVIEAIDPQSPNRLAANAAIECINCAVCYAACDTVAGDPDYLGPAALQRAWTLFNDAKDANKDAVLDSVAAKGGCHACHSMGSCTTFCPNELDPLAAIRGLKRASAARFFGGGKL